MRIHTVTGTVDSADLGYTLMHEHAVTCCDWSMRMGLRSQFCEDGRLLEMAVTQLKRARAAGIDTIVDGTPINLGRDIRLIREAALQSGMNIIVSSGFYHQQDPWLEWKPYEEILGYLDYECAHGLEETDVLPGIMKCAVDYRGITDYIVKMLGVTADCAVKHRIPIFCHTIPELKHGGAMLDIMADHGVPMRAVIAGHSGDVDDIDYLEYHQIHGFHSTWSNQECCNICVHRHCECCQRCDGKCVKCSKDRIFKCEKSYHGTCFTGIHMG